MTPGHLIALLCAACIVRAFLHDSRAAGRPVPVRARPDRRRGRSHPGG